MVSTDFDKRNSNLIVAGKTGGDNSIYVILKSESVLSVMCLKSTPMTWLFWLMLNIYQWRVLHMVITFFGFPRFSYVFLSTAGFGVPLGLAIVGLSSIPAASSSLCC